MANILTCDDAYIGQRVNLLLSNRQVVPVVIEVATSGVPTWAQVLAAGNTTGATPPIVSGVTHMEFEGGGIPAQSGDLRVATGWTLVYRNVANTEDLVAVRTGTGAINDLVIGSGSAATAVDSVNGGAGLELRTAAARRVSINSVRVELLPPRLEWVNNVAPQITQVSNALATGNPLTISAQTTSSATGVGGALALRAGNGGASAGGAGGAVTVQPGTGSTAGQANLNHADGAVGVRLSGTPGAHVGTQAINITADGLGFFDGTPATRPTITGSRGGNTALASLLSELNLMGLIADATTP